MLLNIDTAERATLLEGLDALLDNCSEEVKYTRDAELLRDLLDQHTAVSDLRVKVAEAEEE